LTKYLIFGTVEEQRKDEVKEGDTIEDVSFENRISTEEFLIANTNFSSKDDLLYPGQIVTLGILAPQFRTVEEDYIVQDKTVSHETKYENDDTEYVIEPKVVLNGELRAPIQRGTKVGTVSYTIEDITYEADLLAGNDVEKTYVPIFFLSLFIILIIVLGVNRLLGKLKRKRRLNKMRNS